MYAATLYKIKRKHKAAPTYEVRNVHRTKQKKTQILHLQAISAQIYVSNQT
jgi:hypothetical protein